MNERILRIYESHLSVHMRGERVSIVLLEMIFVGWLAAAAVTASVDADGVGGGGATSAKCYYALRDRSLTIYRPSLFPILILMLPADVATVVLFFYCRFALFSFTFCSALFRSYNAVNIFVKKSM